MVLAVEDLVPDARRLLAPGAFACSSPAEALQEVVEVAVAPPPLSANSRPGANPVILVPLVVLQALQCGERWYQVVDGQQADEKEQGEDLLLDPES